MLRDERGQTATSTEELAMRIQSGEEDNLLELWERVRRFALQQGRRWVRIGRGGVTVEDLEQTAFLALLDALESWKEGGSSFLTWYALRLKAGFTEATGQRTQRDRKDPLEYADSLDAPLTDDPDAGTLVDVIPDPTAERAVEGVAEHDFIAYRQAVIRQALEALTDSQRKAVALRYWEGQPADTRALNAALRALRQPKVSQKLRELL